PSVIHPTSRRKHESIVAGRIPDKRTEPSVLRALRIPASKYPRKETPVPTAAVAERGSDNRMQKRAERTHKRSETAKEIPVLMALRRIRAPNEAGAEDFLRVIVHLASLILLHSYEKKERNIMDVHEKLTN
ncbi:MAG: hypothetical protein IKA76_07805, partial [Clostridia bacterium]|nr:hypothetical protein [Clostridia bacterium]